MKAKVIQKEKIKLLEVDGHWDSFSLCMETNEILEFKPYECDNYDEPVAVGNKWFTCVSVGTKQYGFNYHISWLEVIEN